MVAFKIKLLQFGAVIKAIHFLDHVVEQVYLQDVGAAFERWLADEGQVVFLQVNVSELGTVLAKQSFDFPFAVNLNDRRQSFFGHHQMRHRRKNLCVHVARFLLVFAKDHFIAQIACVLRQLRHFGLFKCKDIRLLLLLLLRAFLEELDSHMQLLQDQLCVFDLELLQVFQRAQFNRLWIVEAVVK